MISIIHTFDMEAGKPIYKPPLKGIYLLIMAVSSITEYASV